MSDPGWWNVKALAQGISGDICSEEEQLGIGGRQWVVIVLLSTGRKKVAWYSKKTCLAPGLTRVFLPSSDQCGSGLLSF